MNYNRVHSLLSKATEAIVTSDGKIKRRLNSYETVVNPQQNDPFYIPDGAVNDNYGNLNYLTAKIRNRNVTSRLSQLRYAMYGAFTLVVVLFTWSAYNFLIPNISTTSDDELVATNDLATTVHEIQLERVANLIVVDNDWSNARITLFMKHWDASSDESRATYRTTAWFQHFSYRLETKFNRAIYTGELFSGDSSAEKHPVYTLALAIGVADPEINYAANLEKNKNYMQLETAVASELAKMEETKIKNEASENLVVADEAALAQLLKDKDGKPLLTTALPAAASTVPTSKASDNKKPQSKEQLKQPVATVTAAAAPSISEQDVSRVFQKYTSAYESGNFKELSSLFGVNDPTMGQRIVDQLKANYENIFANSQKRSVNFKGIKWRFDGNKAFVNSDYLANIELKDNKGTQTITANAKVDIRKTNDNLIISNFELLNRSVSVVTPELSVSATKRAPRDLPVNPTPAELQDIVTRLVSSYESGDLDTFSGLFSTNAKTNDRQDLKGIKADYAELFKGSNDRQMFIQGMEWTFDGNYAKGTGELEAIVLTESGGSVYSMGGKIQLVAQRIDGKVRITHMYHIERKK